MAFRVYNKMVKRYQSFKDDKCSNKSLQITRTHNDGGSEYNGDNWCNSSAIQTLFGKVKAKK